MKWIGILLVVITFFLLGKREIQIYKKKLLFWEEMESLATYFLNELRFTCDEPLKILTRYALQKEVEISPAFSLEQAVSQFLSARILAEELTLTQEVVMFTQGLGTTDLEGQLAHCSRFSRLFEQKAQTACEAYQTQGKLREKLWILAGVSFFLLLV